MSCIAMCIFVTLTASTGHVFACTLLLCQVRSRMHDCGVGTGVRENNPLMRLRGGSEWDHGTGVAAAEMNRTSVSQKGGAETTVMAWERLLDQGACAKSSNAMIAKDKVVEEEKRHGVGIRSSAQDLCKTPAVTRMKSRAGFKGKSEIQRDTVKLKSLTRAQMYRRVARIERKVSVLEARSQKLKDMTGIIEDTLDDGVHGGGAVIDGAEGTDGEIDARRWLRRVRTKIRGLMQQRQRIEGLILGLEEEDEAREEEAARVPWAACDACGKERITTRLLNASAAFVCGDEVTWANTILGEPITCDYRQETEEDTEALAEEVYRPRAAPATRKHRLLLPVLTSDVRIFNGPGDRATRAAFVAQDLDAVLHDKVVAAPGGGERAALYGNCGEAAEPRALSSYQACGDVGRRSVVKDGGACILQWYAQVMRRRKALSGDTSARRQGRRLGLRKRQRAACDAKAAAAPGVGMGTGAGQAKVRVDLAHGGGFGKGRCAGEAGQVATESGAVGGEAPLVRAAPAVAEIELCGEWARSRALCLLLHTLCLADRARLI